MLMLRDSYFKSESCMRKICVYIITPKTPLALERNLCLNIWLIKKIVSLGINKLDLYI